MKEQLFIIYGAIAVGLIACQIAIFFTGIYLHEKSKKLLFEDKQPPRKIDLENH